MTNIDKPIAKAIKEGRYNHNMRQEDLAVRIGVSPQMVSKWETGVSTPGTERIFQLSKVLDLPYTYMRQAIDSEIKMNRPSKSIPVFDPLNPKAEGMPDVLKKAWNELTPHMLFKASGNEYVRTSHKADFVWSEEQPSPNGLSGTTKYHYYISTDVKAMEYPLILFTNLEEISIGSVQRVYDMSGKYCWVLVKNNQVVWTTKDFPRYNIIGSVVAIEIPTV